MPQTDHNAPGLKGVFSATRNVYIGEGATRRKTAQTTLVYAEQSDQPEAGSGEPSILVTPLNPAYLPTGEATPWGLEEFLARHAPEPEIYETKMLPAVRELAKINARGERLRQQGQSYSAEVEFKNALAMDDANARANLGLGLTYLDRGETSLAETQLKKLVKISETFSQDNKHLFNEFGIKLRKNAMYDQALAYYGRALQLASKDDHLYYNIARTLHDKGDYQKALGFIRKALQLDPHSEAAANLAAVLERKIGKTQG